MPRTRGVVLGAHEGRALIDGRLTQIRRPVTVKYLTFLGGQGQEHDPECWGYTFDGRDQHGYMVLARGLDERHNHGHISIPCPLGEPGDGLYGREAWRTGVMLDRVPAGRFGEHSPQRRFALRYEADECQRNGDTLRDFGRVWGRLRSSMTMPQWASRLQFDVTDVQVQRLGDVGADDARAEGLGCWSKDGSLWKWGQAVRHVSGELDAVEPWQDLARSPAEALARIWDVRYGKRYPSSENPWTWVVSVVRRPG